MVPKEAEHLETVNLHCHLLNTSGTPIKNGRLRLSVVIATEIQLESNSKAFMGGVKNFENKAEMTSLTAKVSA